MTMDDATPVSTDTNTLGSYGSGGLKGSPFQYDFALRNSCCDKLAELASVDKTRSNPSVHRACIRSRDPPSRVGKCLINLSL